MNDFFDREEIGDLEPLDDEEYALPGHLSSALLKAPAIPEDDGEFNFLLRNLQNYPFPAAIVSEELIILWANKSYNGLFERSCEHYPASLCEDFPHDLDERACQRVIRTLREPDNDFSERFRLEAKHASRLSKLFNVNITPVYLSSTKKPVYFQVLFDDITQENKILLHGTFLSLLEASKLKDNDTGQHIQRVGEYSKVLAEYLFEHVPEKRITIEFADTIRFLAQMHDVGKIGTPDDILNKETHLDAREWGIMKEHTINGAFIMSTYPHPMAREIARSHHEYWDGNGYPYRIAGDMIPISARIVAVADVYDALRMERSYKSAIDHDRAVSIIRKQAGSHFDPDLTEIFCTLADQFQSIYDRLKDD